MNNEEKILAMLEQMQSQLNRLEEGQSVVEYEISEMKTRQGKTSTVLSEMQRDQIVLKQGQSRIQMDVRDIREDVSDLKHELQEAWKDIGSNEKRILQHETEFHSA